MRFALITRVILTPGWGWVPKSLYDDDAADAAADDA